MHHTKIFRFKSSKIKIISALCQQVELLALKRHLIYGLDTSQITNLYTDIFTVYK